MATLTSMELREKKDSCATGDHGRLLATLLISHRSAPSDMPILSTQWEEDRECHDRLRPNEIQSLWLDILALGQHGRKGTYVTTYNGTHLL